MFPSHGETKEDIRRALAEYEPQSIAAPPGAWPAAVLLLLYEHDGRPHIVFQKRTDEVEHHKGQISFPGGGADPGDRDLVYTALRETHEEIGVHPGDVDVLGRLDELVTISKFHVTPFVGWLGTYPYRWRFSDPEVAYLLEVSLDHLREPATFVPDRRVINGREFVLPSYQFRDDIIWGATARMLANFLDVVATVPSAVRERS
jgi:8-oxo-dGTP pyrophosphatase MutT (NUDIX family)